MTNLIGLTLRDFSGRLNDLDNSASIKDLVLEVIEPIGFRNFAYHIIQTPDVENISAKQALGITSYPDEWSRHYISSGYVNDDPIIAKVFEETAPFVWSDSLVVDDLSKKQRKLLEDANSLGISNGLTIPLLSRNGETASLSLIPHDMSMDKLRCEKTINIVHLIGEYLHRRASRIVIEENMTGNSKRRKSLLSPREAETLTWVARGKSSWDIANILELSEKSVEFHLDSVKRKLQATNRTQAVVKAIVLGLITFKD